METGTAKKKSMNPAMGVAKKSGAKTTDPSHFVQPTSIKFVEPNKNLGDLLIKSTTMSKVQDKKTGMFRQIRYIEGTQTIFVDEQGDVSGLTIKPIELIRGEKLISDPLLIEFMRASDQNVANGGKVFKEENPEKDAQVELDNKQAIAEAFYMANKGLEIGKIRAIVRSLGVPNVALLPDAVVRLEAVRLAEGSPERFLEAIESPLPDVIESVGIALERGVISFSTDRYSVGWADSKTTFMKIPPGYEEERLEFIAKYMLTEDGAEVLEAINKAIKKK